MRALLPTVLLLAAGAHAWAQVPAGGEFQVNSYTTGDQTGPRVVVSPIGRFVVSWTGRVARPEDLRVSARTFTDTGVPLGDEFRVNTTDTAALSALALRHLDRLVAVWDANDGIRGQRYTTSWTPSGAEFRVNTYTTSTQYRPDVAPLRGGGFVVTWSFSGLSVPHRILAQRYDAQGTALGSEMLVSGSPASGVFENFPSISAARDGAFVVVWKHSLTGQSFLQGRRFDAAGAAGPLFQVNESADLGATFPRVAMAHDGSFVVVWWASTGDGSQEAVRARLFTPAGVPAGSEFTVNEQTLGAQILPSVASGPLGDFVVAWSSGPSTAGPFDVMARRFNASGAPRGGDFRVNTYTTGDQVQGEVASDPAGNFVVSWKSNGQDGSGYGVFGQRFGGLLPVALDVDTVAAGQSDGNGVLEPGETVDVRPRWRNVTGALQFPSGMLAGFNGPPGAAYTVVDPAATYGSIPDLASGTCVGCYAVGVSAPAPRPARHWDAAARENLAPEAQGQRALWPLHVGDTFTDVPRSSLYYRFVETLVHNDVTAGCTEANYCPLSSVSREQMAVFAVVARDRAGDPPPACGTPVFGDVPASSPFCRWIEELARAGAVSGCGGGNYCPSAPVSREQMPVFVLRTLNPALDPPACAAPMFSDVPADSPFCRWIEELARRGVVGGCGGGRYCPADPVTREQMGVFIAAGFGLQLYGP